jgi:hypothetical protein
MDDSPLSQLTAEQQAALSEELKAAYVLLAPADQSFFAKTFTPADLPTVLARKAEILKRSQAQRERLAQLQLEYAQNAAAHPPVDDKAEGVMGAVAGVLGLGAAAAIVASDNSAHYRGVRPQDLVEPLRAEFAGGNTMIQFSGQASALLGTISLVGSGGPVAAMTLNLSAVDSGLEIKINDLTTRGMLETVKEGGRKLFDAAGDVVNLITRGQRGQVSPADLMDVVEHGAGLAETAAALKLKERAWKVIRQAAESVEAVYLSRLEQERAARGVLEKAWDNTYNCPTCGVAFGAEDKQCRVCSTARPEAPQKPDPRINT